MHCLLHSPGSATRRPESLPSFLPSIHGPQNREPTDAEGSKNPKKEFQKSDKTGGVIIGIYVTSCRISMLYHIG